MRGYFSGLLIGREAVLETARTLPKLGAGVVSRTASSRRARPQNHCLSRRRSTAWASPGASRCARREPLGLPISPLWIPPSGMGVNGLRRHPGRRASPVGSSRRRVFRARVPAPRSALSSRPRQRGAPRHLQCIRGLTGWRSIPLLRAPRPGLRRGCRRLPGRIGGRGATPTSATSPGVAASRAHAATTSVRSSNAFRVRLNGSQPVGCRAALAFFFSSTAPFTTRCTA
jgi:hypothetical protein